LKENEILSVKKSIKSDRSQLGAQSQKLK
jgi:hypothetical protein